jgi:hypothetical protein
MSTTEDRSASTSGMQGTGSVDMKLGAADPDWPDWYAYMVAEQAGTELPQ